MLNKALRLIRVFHDKTQTELARELGISKSHLSEIESGKKAASVELLGRYSVVFNVPLSSIIFFSENIEKRPNLEHARGVIASKIVKILSFIAENSDEGERDGDKAEAI